MRWEPQTLTTDRLILRPVDSDDIDAIYSACSNPHVTEHTLFETHKDRGDAVQYLHTYVIPNYHHGIPDPLGIALKSDPGTLIGCTGGHWNTEANRCIEFGYWLAEPYWGQGIATEAVIGVIPYLLESMAAERLQAHVMTPNIASARVLEKAGLTYEGTLRSAVLRRGKFWDIRMYSLLRDEWDSRRSSHS